MFTSFSLALLPGRGLHVHLLLLSLVPRPFGPGSEAAAVPRPFGPGSEAAAVPRPFGPGSEAAAVASKSVSWLMVSFRMRCWLS